MSGKGVIGYIPDIDDDSGKEQVQAPLKIETTKPQPLEKKNTDKKDSHPDSESKKILRAAGGVIWEDPSLAEWDPKEFRIFVGDLGRDVSDELLFSTFHDQFPSTKKAKVVRDKHTGRSKGFGFVAISDEGEFKMAMRSMHGKYIGSRPVKLKKSNWSDRNVDNGDVGLMKRIGYKVAKKH